MVEGCKLEPVACASVTPPCFQDKSLILYLIKVLLTQFDLRVPWTFLLTEMPGVLKISVLKKTLPVRWLGPSCWHSQTCLMSSDFHLQSRGESQKEYCTSRSMITNVCSNTSVWSAHGNTSFENHSSKAAWPKIRTLSCPVWRASLTKNLLNLHFKTSLTSWFKCAVWLKICNLFCVCCGSAMNVTDYFHFLFLYQIVPVGLEEVASFFS